MMYLYRLMIESIKEIRVELINTLFYFHLLLYMRLFKYEKYQK